VSGALVVVGTPIGNLGDLAPRAAEALAGADVVACEDTRRSGRLLQLSGIGHRPMLVLNEHTEHDRLAEVVERVAAGQRVALVSDAGMPAISDPGQRVVAAVLDAGLAVEVVPGPTALATALVLSGLPSDRFCFEGFLPRKGPDRAARLAEVAAEVRTVVLYEAPHRLRRTLEDLVAVAGADRPVAVGRELTKLHEEVWRGRLGEACDRAAGDPPRGEHVVVLGGAPAAPAPQWDDDDLRSLLLAAIERGSSRRDATDEVVARTGAPRRRVYALAAELG
jgi:16S rRNA (cytidine1402-2'-O)-methyltransferase